MLRIDTGPFHPTLEQALCDRLLEIKGPHPLAPITLVVPSEPLRRFLQWHLANQANLSLVNIHFFTFYQFAQKLLDESMEGGENVFPLQISSVSILQEAVHSILQNRLPPASPLKQFIPIPGAWAALWSTLKDLKDAAIPWETESIEEMLLQKSGLGNTERGQVLQDLLSIYGELRREMAAVPMGDYEDLSVQAIDRVSTSPFLRNQQAILYYGFYDLTQIQLDFFHHVVREYPSHCFFPLIPGDPSYLFAEQFFDRFIRGLATDDLRQYSSSSSSSPPLSPRTSPCQIHIYNVRGHRQEVTVVAKDIIRLVEERGYAFHDIGIIARSLNDYAHLLPSVFFDHHIPFQSSLGQPLTFFPFVHSVIQLLRLPINGFRTKDLLAFLSSHYILEKQVHPTGQEYPGPCRVDQLEALQDHLTSQGGIYSWTPLTNIVHPSMTTEALRTSHADPSHLTEAQQEWILTAANNLQAELTYLLERGSWSFYAEQAKRCIGRFLDPLFRKEQVEEVWPLQDVLAAVLRCLDQLEILDKLDSEISFSEFLDALVRVLEESISPQGSFNGQGVQVFDAMEARGITFRAVFLLGVNESRFPRNIQEDAFLRDDVRRVLETDLGYKIAEKLEGYREEELLFALLTNSAKEELTILYIRSDDEGKPALPSSYVESFKSRYGAPMTEKIPTPQAERRRRGLSYPLERLTQEEVLIESLLRRELHHDLLRLEASRFPDLSYVVEEIRSLDAQGPLGPYDGLTGMLDNFWARTQEKGISPSALEQYATCPFQYFSSHVLGLPQKKEQRMNSSLLPKEAGLLIHSILHRMMKTLQSEGVLTDPKSQDFDPIPLLHRLATEEFETYSATQWTGFPLLWELRQQELLDVLTEALKQDLNELRENRWEPILFEQEMNGTLSLKNTKYDGVIKIRGYLDRVDRSINRKAYRIIDYKYKVSKHPGTLDKNLDLAAVRGVHLQPPLYLKLLRDSDGSRIQDIAQLEESSECQGVWFYYLAPYWKKKEGQGIVPIEFSGKGWSHPVGPVIKNTVAHIMHGIQQGRFFITPGTQCDSCGYRLFCRNSHMPTRLRTRTASERQVLSQQIKKAQVPKN